MTPTKRRPVVPINESQRSARRWIALVIAVVLFAASWFIACGNVVFDSTNSEAFRTSGLFFFALSFVP